jgi:enoyl-CoA hydratase/carnithine racemase
MGEVSYEKKGKTAWIVMNRPDKNNAIGLQVRKELLEIWQDIEKDDSIWCAVLTGGTKVFSTGLDMVELAEFRRTEPLGELPFTGMDVFGAGLSKPVIAAISGYCLGGAFFLTMACADIRIATTTARFGMPEVKIGITPAYGIPALMAAHFPPSVVKELLLMGQNVSGEILQRYGYVRQVVAPEELMSAADKCADAIGEVSPLVLRNIKKIVNTVTAPDPRGVAFSNSVCLMSRLSDDYIEGPRAFKEKRKPVWKGR